MQDFSVRTPERQIERIHVEVQQRDGSYIMPVNHCHPYCELYYLESGSCRFFLGESMLDLHGGDMLLIPPQTLHYTRYLFGPCRRCNVFFRTEDADAAVLRLLPGGSAFFRDWRLLQVPDFYRDALSALFSRMLSEERIADERTPLLLHHRLMDMLLVLSRVAVVPEAAPSDIHTTDRAIVRAAGYICEHLAEPLRAEDIADAAGLSVNYLSRRFRQVTGIGVHEYLTYQRLRRAALELAETGDSVTDIALRCGFSDGNYFKDCFKRRYGVSPRAYRSSRA